MGQVKAIPDGYEGAVPYLIVDGAAKALDFYKAAFGATEVHRMLDASGRVRHAEFRIGRAVLMLADEYPDIQCRTPGPSEARPSAS